MRLFQTKWFANQAAADSFMATKRRDGYKLVMITKAGGYEVTYWPCNNWLVMAK